MVDDNEKNRELCELNLDMEGFDVLLAQNGKEGVEMAEARQPDVVLLDIMMPVMDGYEALRAMKTNPRISDTPVLMLTAKAAVGDVVKALDMGANDYLRKPFDIGELIARVKTLVALKKAQDAVKENQKRLAQELTWARKIQQNLLPGEKELEEFSNVGLGVYGFTRSASEVNGDFFDVRFLGRHMVCSVVVDCKGHGVSAGMMTMAVHALLDSLVPALPSACEPLNDMDRKLRSVGPSSEFAGMIYLLYGIHDGNVLISRAGMPFPIIISSEDGQAREFPVAGGPPLGLPSKPTDFEETEVKLNPGDKVVMFSDGLIEAVNHEGDMFGIPGKRFINLINQFSHLSPDEMGRRIISEWEAFTRGEQDDDCTLVILERLGA